MTTYKGTPKIFYAKMQYEDHYGDEDKKTPALQREYNVLQISESADFEIVDDFQIEGDAFKYKPSALHNDFINHLGEVKAIVKGGGKRKTRRANTKKRNRRGH